MLSPDTELNRREAARPPGAPNQTPSSLGHEVWPSILALAALHVLLFLVAFTVGWSLGDSEIPARTPGRFWPDMLSIFSTNSRSLWVLIVASVLTAGIAALAQVMLNGLVFGWLVGSAGASVWLLLYAPLEVCAFAWAAGSALRVFLHVVASLRRGSRPDRRLLRHCLRHMLAAWGTLLPAAALEALAIQLP